MNKGIGREGGEGAIKRDDEQVGDAELAEDERFVQRGGEEARRGGGPQDLHGMRIESGDDHSAAIVFTGGLGAADDFLMAGVHAVEESNREMHRAGQGGKVGDSEKDFQRSGRRREKENRLFDVINKIINLNGGVTERSFQSVAVHFIMEREDDTPAIFVLHFNVASLPVDFDEAETLQGG